MLQSNQKIIKVGTSSAVTVPVKVMKQLARQNGDELKITYELPDKPDQAKVELVELTQKLIKRHQKALDNLSQR